MPPPVDSGSADQKTTISVCLSASSRRSYCSGMPRRWLLPHIGMAPQCQPSQLSGLWAVWTIPIRLRKR